MPKDAYMLPSA